MKSPHILIITFSIIFALTGCAGKARTFTLWSGQDIIFPNGTILGSASTEQATSLAEIFVNAHNETMGQLQNLSKTTEQQQKTAEKALNIIEHLSKYQGTGEITLFFPTGQHQIRPNSLDYNRLVRFLDFLSRESHGRKILLISIGSASAFGYDKHNEYLAGRRAVAPIDAVEKYLVNIPYEFYKVYDVGARYSPSDISLKKQKNYQHTRLIAIFETEQIPELPM